MLGCVNGLCRHKQKSERTHDFFICTVYPSQFHTWSISYLLYGLTYTIYSNLNHIAVLSRQINLPYRCWECDNDACYFDYNNHDIVGFCAPSSLRGDFDGRCDESEFLMLAVHLTLCRKWFVHSVPNHYPNQCWCVVDCTITNQISEFLIITNHLSHKTNL